MSWSNQSKNTSSFSNDSKSTSSFSNQSLHTANFVNQNNSDVSPFLWGLIIFPWQLALPWQWSSGQISRTYNYILKNTSSFSNQTKN